MLILFENLHSVVAASIINCVYMEILIGLCQHTVDGAVHISSNVVAGYDDIDFALSWWAGWQRREELVIIFGVDSLVQLACTNHVICLVREIVTDLSKACHIDLLIQVDALDVRQDYPHP
jgi:hypothetical protein